MVLSAVCLALQLLNTLLLRCSVASSNVIANSFTVTRAESKGFRWPDFAIHMTHMKLVSSTSDSSSSLLRSTSISVSDTDSESIAVGITAFSFPFPEPDIRKLQQEQTVFGFRCWDFRPCSSALFRRNRFGLRNSMRLND